MPPLIRHTPGCFKEEDEEQKKRRLKMKKKRPLRSSQKEDNVSLKLSDAGEAVLKKETRRKWRRDGKIKRKATNVLTERRKRRPLSDTQQANLRKKARRKGRKNGEIRRKKKATEFLTERIKCLLYPTHARLYQGLPSHTQLRMYLQPTCRRCRGRCH